MYFSTVFVLFLTFKFMQLQPILVPVQQQDSTITPILPFGYQYTEETDEFLKKVIEDFRICPLEKLKIYMNDFLQTRMNYSDNEDRCKTKKIRRPPFFVLEGETCNEWCGENNPQYVQFLNNNIRMFKDILFEDGEDNILVLNAIDSAGGHCILYDALERVNQLDRDQVTIRREEFSALAILLKFYPQNAVFYLAYLFYKYNPSFIKSRFAITVVNVQSGDGNADDIPPSQPSHSQYTPVGVIIDGVVIEDTGNGMVEDRGIIADNGTVIRIFMKLYELIVNDLCDPLDVGRTYYSKITERPDSLRFLYVLNGTLWFLLGRAVAKILIDYST